METLEHDLDCPFCGETIQIVVDTSVAQQTYVEDCFVCCRPIKISVSCSDGEVVSVFGERE